MAIRTTAAVTIENDLNVTGDFYCQAAMSFQLTDNTENAISFDASGATGLIAIDTTNNAEKVRIGAGAVTPFEIDVSTGNIYINGGDPDLFNGFPNAKMIVRESDTGFASSSDYAIVAEAVGKAFYGVGLTSGGTSGGNTFEAGVSSSSDSGFATAVHAISNDTHASGYNVGLRCDVSGGASNYAIYIRGP